MVVCQPTPQKAVQVIVQQISDHDTNMRNAALNTLVIIYDNIGETVYKYAGQVCVCMNRYFVHNVCTVYTYTYMCRHPAGMHTHTSIHAYLCIHTRACMHVCVCMYVCLQLCIHVCVLACACVSVHVCLCIGVCTCV